MIKLTKELANLVAEVSPQKRKAKMKLLIDFKHMPEAWAYLERMSKKHECSITTLVKALVESARKMAEGT